MRANVSVISLYLDQDYNRSQRYVVFDGKAAINQEQVKIVNEIL